MTTFASEIIHLVQEDTYTGTQSVSIKEKLKAYKVFVKFRLNFLVVLSALSGYLLAPSSTYDTFSMCMLMLGGFLVTGASNGMNQIIECDVDAKMNRTKERPLPTGKMSITEAWIASILMGAVGLFVLYEFLNFKSALLSFTALFLYVAVYTPMKKVSPWAVFVGAFPGAIPPMLGWLAATDDFSFVPGILFFIQFMWQFPHFWAVAWVAKDDYDKAGYKLLPSNGGRNKFTSWQIMIYTLVLIPVSLMPWLLFNESFNVDTPIAIGNLSLFVVAICGLLFYLFAQKLHMSNDMKDAKRMMFASFIYLPIVQFIYVLDKINL